MVDFKKRLAGKRIEKPTNPIKIYESLDRSHDKGPLRPAQESVLNDWSSSDPSIRDVIVKLHTGQGKTLVGLLMLQSKLNSGLGPVVYMCPDHYLIEQTCEQARQFGISVCKADDDLPEEFLASKKILITSVQKLFNGLTKFGVGRGSIEIGALLMDDAHACADRIREACRIRLAYEEPGYQALVSLFSNDLEAQGVGTFADIANGKRDCYLPVPYWAWIDKEQEIAKILSMHADRRSIKFAWPLIKDIIRNCSCIVSGAALEIEPYAAPLSMFGSYWRAKHRIFMSATVTDDAFLIKGLQINPQTIKKPLTYSKETWSGEKMILVPSMIHESLGRDVIVSMYAASDERRKYGVVALAPSFARTNDWTTLGALVVDKDTVLSTLNDLKKGKFEKTIVLVNRYDGIDLPDETCRILIFDSRPYSENLFDLYQERCRPESEATLMRTLRSIEQGMGRSVRGEKDYSVVMVTGADLSRMIRDKSSRRLLSAQMSTQIEIGLEVAELAIQDLHEGREPKEVLLALVRQCLGRDDGWKEFYIENMKGVVPKGANDRILDIYEKELSAELAFQAGSYSKACEILQKLIDSGTIDLDDKSWYLQEIARYSCISDKIESQRLQVLAHSKNRLLLKPPSGVTVEKLEIVSHGRAERISSWISSFGNYGDMNIRVSEILGRLTFGTKAERFEDALNELSKALGFAGERPDAEWKEGPDNLWALDSTHYILFECKSEVEVTRLAVNKREAEQMNRSCAWFGKHYEGLKSKNLIIHPSLKIESAAAFTHDVEGLNEAGLKKLVRACSGFFKSFEKYDFKDMSSAQIQKLLNLHKLAITNFLNDYSAKLKDLKS